MAKHLSVALIAALFTLQSNSTEAAEDSCPNVSNALHWRVIEIGDILTASVEMPRKGSSEPDRFAISCNPKDLDGGKTELAVSLQLPEASNSNLQGAVVMDLKVQAKTKRVTTRTRTRTKYRTVTRKIKERTGKKKKDGSPIYRVRTVKKRMPYTVKERQRLTSTGVSTKKDFSLKAQYLATNGTAQLLHVFDPQHRLQDLKNFVSDLTSGETLQLAVANPKFSRRFTLHGSCRALAKIRERCVAKYPEYNTPEPRERMLFTYRDPLAGKRLEVNGSARPVDWLTIEVEPDFNSNYKSLADLFGAESESAGLSFVATVSFNVGGRILRSRTARCSTWSNNVSLCKMADNQAHPSFLIRRMGPRQPKIVYFQLDRQARFEIDDEVVRAPRAMRRVGLRLNRSW